MLEETLRVVIKVVVFCSMAIVGTDCNLAGLRDSLRRPELAAVVGIAVLGRPELVRFATALFTIQAVMLLTLMLTFVRKRKASSVSS